MRFSVAILLLEHNIILPWSYVSFLWTRIESSLHKPEIKIDSRDLIKQRPMKRVITVASVDDQNGLRNLNKGDIQKPICLCTDFVSVSNDGNRLHRVN